MSYMLMSQMSHTKLNTKMLICQFQPIPNESLSQMILDFLSPFYYQLKGKNIKIEVIECNQVPSWSCTDWDIYK